jgi:hypothetical protein
VANGDERYPVIIDIATLQRLGFKYFIRLWFCDDSPGAVESANIGFPAFWCKVSDSTQQIWAIRGQGNHLPRHIECALQVRESESVD